MITHQAVRKSGTACARFAASQVFFMTMHKQFVAVLAFIPFVLTAQKDVVSAYNANVDGDYLKAAEFIDNAIEDVCEYGGVGQTS